MPKLSIIIPTFNSAGTLERCLDSIRIQTFKNYEVVIQDGGSSDRTVELVEAFARDNPGIKIELQRERDHGVYDAMNMAMRRVSGEWLYFLGSDDELYDRHVLQKILGGRVAPEVDVLYGNVKMVGGSTRVVKDGTLYDGPFDLAKLLRKNICHQAMFYRASFLREVGDYNTDYAVLADWDLNMRCWAKGRFKYKHLVVAKFSLGGLSPKTLDLRFHADLPTNEGRYFGKSADKARRSARKSPSRVVKALARRLNLTRWQ